VLQGPCAHPYLNQLFFTLSLVLLCCKALVLILHRITFLCSPSVLRGPQLSVEQEGEAACAADALITPVLKQHKLTLTYEALQ